MTDANNDPIAPFPTLPPRPPAHVVPTLFNQQLRNREDSKNAFYCFLGTTKRAESPSSILGSDNHELTDILKLIFAYVKFEMMSMDKSKYRYKVRMQMCRGISPNVNVEYVNVEALANKGGPWKEAQPSPRSGGRANNFLEEQGHDDQFCGVLITRTGLGFSFHEQLIRLLAQLCNEDGSHYTEGQLRSSWKELDGHDCTGTGMIHCMRPYRMVALFAAAMLPPEFIPRISSCEFCNGTSPVPEVARPAPLRGQTPRVPRPPPAPEFHYYDCNKLCMALPGDTIYWKCLEPSRRIVFRWETATDEDLIERGHVEPGMTGQQGLLYSMCRAYREARQTCRLS